MTEQKPNWLKGFTDIDTKLEQEPFAKVVSKADLRDFNGYIVMANNTAGTKKVAFPLRIEEEINSELEQCNGSKNAVINALLKYAINDLREKNKTLFD